MVGRLADEDKHSIKIGWESRCKCSELLFASQCRMQSSKWFGIWCFWSTLQFTLNNKITMMTVMFLCITQTITMSNNNCDVNSFEIFFSSIFLQVMKYYRLCERLDLSPHNCDVIVWISFIVHITTIWTLLHKTVLTSKKNEAFKNGPSVVCLQVAPSENQCKSSLRSVQHLWCTNVDLRAAVIKKNKK